MIHDNPFFWATLEQFVTSSQIVVDRPKGSLHPRFPDIIYPLDYGFLEGTTGGDGDGIDVWFGSGESRGGEA
jgi:inorganic pyrophosphatase